MVGEKDRISLLFTVLHADPQRLQEACRLQPGVEEGQPDGGAVHHARRGRAQALPWACSRRLKKLDVRVQAVEIKEPNLETVFLHLTVGALRD